MFRFLLTVRRTQLALHRVWAAEVTENRTMRMRRKTTGGEEQQEEETEMQLLRLRRLQRLRLHMTLVVDNLQQYFMADVLGAQFDRLDKRWQYNIVAYLHNTVKSR